MKKLFLLTISSFVTLGAFAQANQHGIPFVKTRTVKEPIHQGIENMPSAPRNTAANKTTATAPRWYSQHDALGATNLLPNINSNNYVIPIWFDSTVTQRFSTGYDRINYSSVCQVIDPIGSKIFNDVTAYTGEMKVLGGNSYKVDSIYITSAYVKMKTRPSSIVDTLILSVIPKGNRTYYLTKNSYATIPSYTGGKDTIWAMAPLNVDSVNRAAFTDTSSQTRAFWKVPLTDADRDTILANGNVTLRTRVFAVPGGGLTIPAGNRFAITATFKSGDTWTKNVDSVNMFHRFMPLSSYGTGTTAQMPYYYYDYTDRSHSSLMFSWDSSQYSPSVFIEIWNTNNFSYEFHDMGGRVVCDNCYIVGVENVRQNITAAKAYPNPANNEIAIDVDMKEAAPTKINITNTVGQVVATYDMGNIRNGKAVISTANMPNGMYLYTVDANGERYTQRFVVSH